MILFNNSNLSANFLTGSHSLFISMYQSGSIFHNVTRNRTKLSSRQVICYGCAVVPIAFGTSVQLSLSHTKLTQQLVAGDISRVVKYCCLVLFAYTHRLYYTEKSVLCHPVYGEIFQYLIGEWMSFVCLFVFQWSIGGRLAIS